MNVVTTKWGLTEPGDLVIDGEWMTQAILKLRLSKVVMLHRSAWHDQNNYMTIDVWHHTGLMSIARHFNDKCTRLET